MSSPVSHDRKRKADVDEDTACPYLDTIQRSLLDFDQAPSCSVSLQSGPHIYACLVCGKFFRGRGSKTPAYTHAVEAGHYCFVHLQTAVFYCLPDDYEIRDPSLDDIRVALQPSYSPTQIQQLNTRSDLGRDLFGTKYVPGFVGLHNHGKTDGLNAIIQALAHVEPLRNYFLQASETTAAAPVTTASVDSIKQTNIRAALQVTQAFGALVRRIWSDQRFKATVDPQQMVQAVAASYPHFRVGQQPEVGALLAWILHQLHLGTANSTTFSSNGGDKQPPAAIKKKKSNRRRGHTSSIIHQLFQGKVRVTTREAKPKEDNTVDASDDRLGSDNEQNEDNEEREKASNNLAVEESTMDTHFLQLTLDIPAKPLFRDADGGLVIPQEPLVNVLKKFDGVTLTDAVNRKTGAAQRKSYQLLKLPQHLILHLGRFKENGYTREKNPTIVVFPVKNFDLSSYVTKKQKRPLPSEEEVRNMSVRLGLLYRCDLSVLSFHVNSLDPAITHFFFIQVKDIKQLLNDYGQKELAAKAVEKKDFIDMTVDFVCKSLPDLLAEKYDLVANITHESPADVGREGKVDPLQEGSYKCHVQHPATKQWYEIQDLHVQEIMPQQIGLSESHVLVFRKTTKSC